ncbi:MAG: hypothetical protein PHW08_00480 [Kiritimatiellae bacterium]|nr:hypothetical protein [Kiritimatiellia bacterium]
MSPEENVMALIGRIDELTAQLEHGERLVFEQAARLGGIRRELETARKAVVELVKGNLKLEIGNSKLETGRATA